MKGFSSLAPVPRKSPGSRVTGAGLLTQAMAAISKPEVHDGVDTRGAAAAQRTFEVEGIFAGTASQLVETPAALQRAVAPNR